MTARKLPCKIKQPFCCACALRCAHKTVARHCLYSFLRDELKQRSTKPLAPILSFSPDGALQLFQVCVWACALASQSLSMLCPVFLQLPHHTLCYHPQAKRGSRGVCLLSRVACMSLCVWIYCTDVPLICLSLHRSLSTTLGMCLLKVRLAACGCWWLTRWAGCYSAASMPNTNPTTCHL